MKSQRCIEWRLLHTLKGHTDSVDSVSISPDGKTLVSGSMDTSVRHWEITLGKCLAVLTQHMDWVATAEHSPDGKMIVTGGFDRRIKLIGRREEPETFWGNGKSVVALAFSPSGDILLSAGGDGMVYQWQIPTMEKRLFCKQAEIVSVLDFSPDGNLVALSGDANMLEIRNLDGDIVMVMEGHAEWINSLAFHPDGDLIASASEDCTVHLWSFEKGLLPHVIHETPVNAVAFSPDGLLFATGSNDSIVRLWTLEGELIANLTGHTSGINDLDFGLDGTRLILVSASCDTTIKVWEISAACDEELSDGCSDRI